MHRRGYAGHGRDKNQHTSRHRKQKSNTRLGSEADPEQFELPFAGEIPLSAERLEARKAAVQAAWDALSAVLDGPTARTT